MRDNIIRQKKRLDEHFSKDQQRKRYEAASGNDWENERLLRHLEKGGMSLEEASGLLSDIRKTEKPTIPPLSKSHAYTLVLNMGDGRFVSIKRTSEGAYLETFSVGIVNRKLLESATRRGHKSSPTGSRFLVHGTEELRRLPYRKRIDPDMREPLKEVVENFLAGPGKQPVVKEFTYSNTPGLEGYLKEHD